MAQVSQMQRVASEEKSLNKVESKTFIKKMLAIGISNIVYLRNLFPESAFSDRKIEDLPLKILKENNHESAGRIVQWMKGVYDAVDKEFLRALIFAIVTDPQKPDSVVESYIFGFTYDQGRVQASVTIGDNTKTQTKIPTQDQTKDSAKQFLRNLLLLTSTLEPLPNNVFMTVRLLYYDKVTPKDYQPPGFVEAVEKDCLGFDQDFENVRIKLGNIVTPHTSLKVRMRTGKKQFQRNEGDNNKPNFVIEDSEGTVVSMKNQSDCSEQQPMDLDNEPESDLGVRCACLDPDNDGTMILCHLCRYWQHAICFCLFDKSNIPEVHICHLCGDNVTYKCTDPQLTGLKREQQQIISTWRRTLLFCNETDTVSVAMISNYLSCSRVLAQKLISKLMEEKVAIVIAGQQKQTKKINKENLERVFNREIKHVAENLFLQRKDESLNTSCGGCNTNGKDSKKAKRPAETDDNHMNVEPTAEKHHYLDPPNTQSSVDAFRADQVGVCSRKKRKMSRTAALRRKS